MDQNDMNPMQEGEVVEETAAPAVSEEAAEETSSEPAA